MKADLSVERLFRNRGFWLLFLPIFGWAVSFFWLGIYILIIPFFWTVFFLAVPSGFIYALTGREVIWRDSIDAFIFYAILIPPAAYFIYNLKTLPQKKLYIISTICLLIFLVTLGGCSQLPSLRSP